MKKVLMVAFHYPPYRGGSGVQRTLKFSKYLPEHGWQPIVLSAHPRAYPSTGTEQLAEIPEQVVVERAFALDTGRHLSWRGRYLRFMALPDQWESWWWGGMFTGLKLIQKHRPSVIWSTYPIATAHLIGLTLQRLTGIPWIADFRDSMTEDDYPRDALTRRSYRWIERKTVEFGARLIFTTLSTRRMYLDRYPGTAQEKCLIIPNGYDEENFKDIALKEPAIQYNGRPLRLLHAGIIYTDDRDPRPFFRGLSRLKKAGLVNGKTMSVDLRASGSEDYYSTLVRELQIADLIRLLPPLPYHQALQECAAADALLLFQAASCNHQIPAKVYEYLRLRKPILALTSHQGDTAALLRETGGATIVDLANEELIVFALPRFIAQIRNGTHTLPDPDKVRHYARSHQALDLATRLNELAGIKAT
jgi:glycosyltransferase involved in cell wall biosynthesis